MRTLMFLVALSATGFAGYAYADDECSGSSTIVSVSNWIISPDKNANPTVFKIYDMSETIASASPKEIRLIDGEMRFADALGANIGALEIDRDARISASIPYIQHGVWSPQAAFGTYFDRLLKMDRADVVVTTCVKAVVYVDGSKQAFN